MTEPDDQPQQRLLERGLFGKRGSFFSESKSFSLQIRFQYEAKSCVVSSRRGSAPRDSFLFDMKCYELVKNVVLALKCLGLACF